MSRFNSSHDRHKLRASRQQPGFRRRTLTFRPVIESLEERSLLSVSTYVPPQYDLFVPGGYLTGPSSAAPLTIAENYLRNNAASVGLVSADFDDYLVTTNYVTQSTGATTLTLAQTLHDLPVFNANFNITVAADGRLLSIGGGFVPGLRHQAELEFATPGMAADQAIVAAANVLGRSLATPPTLAPQSSGGPSMWSAPGLSLDDISTRLRYVAMPGNQVNLAWNLTVRTPDNSHWYNVDVDADTGSLVGLIDYASHATYEVIALPNLNPDDSPRTIETDPHVFDPTPAPLPSPFGWHDTDGVAGPEFTTTQGNNVNAYADRNADDLPDDGSQPDGGPTLNFTGALVAANFNQEPSTYTAAAVANLFYWTNILHDVHYLYGFDEAARNFQVNNYGRGGVGGDAVNAEAQDGSGTNNANFATPPDGTAPRMQMFEFDITSPGRDGDFEPMIIIHEYGHGVSNRLTGNGQGLFALQSRGMGEGWSDFWSLMLTQKTAGETTTGRGTGTYVLGQPLSGPGIRDFRYDFDIGDVNNETFLDFGLGIGQSVQVHDAGTRWSAALWDINHLLIEKYGFDPNIYNSTSDAGNIKAMHLVTNALKIQPLNPTFIQARNAILAADTLLYGGANQLEIWTAFARRGLGQFASTPGSDSTSLTTSFVIPPEVFRQLSVSDIALEEGDSGEKSFVFAVSLSSANANPITVVYQSVPSTATPGVDFNAVSGTLTFSPGGPLVQNVTVQVLGDTAAEPHETFLLRLSNPTNANLADGEGLATILNDDLEFRVSDASVLEGNGGGRNAVFAISTFGVVERSVSVSFTTLNITATAGSDYQPRAGALTFAPGGGSINVTVPIVSDLFNESTETFKLLLLNPQGGRLLDEEGIATILDDDPTPGLYINDVNVTTTEAGTLAAVFTVALDAPSGQNVSVQVATSDNTAYSGLDYQGLNSLLQFAPGVTSQTVTVPVLTSDLYSPNKTFMVNLYGVVNARLADSQGIGRIIFAAPPVNELILDNGDAGFSRSGGWTNLTNTLAYGLDYEYHAAGNGSGHATWSFGNLPTGAYEVFAKWIPFSNRATNAPYTVLDAGATLGTVLVNQQQFPTGEQSNGITWQSLGFFSTATGTLNVRLNDNANGLVIADAIRIVKDGIALQTPEMDVASFGRSIGTGDTTPALEDGTDFGATASLTNSLTRTFTISNTGNAALNLNGSPRVQIMGLHPQDFTVVAQPAASVAAGQSTTFQIMFDPTALGLRQAIVSIANNDDSEAPYTFLVQGVGASPGPASWVIDNTSAGFATQGTWNSNAAASAYQGQMLTSAAGAGGDTAQWTFGGLSPGRYDVYATWASQADRAPAAPFTVADSGGSHYTLNVNQRQSPNIPINGTNWGTLGSIDISTGTLTVRLASAAGGSVSADAIMVVKHDAPHQPGTLLTHNAAMPLDVNGDSQVSGYDALLVISTLLSSAASPQAVPLTSSGASYYTDVSGDGQVSPRDALLVISHLLAAPSAAPQSAVAAGLLNEGDASEADSTAELAAIDAALSQMDPSEPEPAPLPIVVALTAVEVAGEQAAPRANPWAVATVLAEAEEDEADDEADALLLVLSE